jgi:archaellum component FlaG (FlaF/FlaG flagellin family)
VVFYNPPFILPSMVDGQQMTVYTFSILNTPYTGTMYVRATGEVVLMYDADDILVHSAVVASEAIARDQLLLDARLATA